MSDRDAKFFNPGDLPPAPLAAVKEITTEADFEALLASARGPVVVDFVEDGCGACDENTPFVDKLATTCDSVTVARVDVAQLPELADRFPQVDGTPTTLYAPSGAQFTPEAVKEVDAADPAFRRKLKCARTKKS